MLDMYLTMESVAQPKLKDITLEQVLKALGDPVRLSIVKQLLAVPGQEKACGTFDHDITKATFSHHLKILHEAGIISQRLEGTRKMSSLRKEDLHKKFPGLLEMVASAK
jgi:DNA-binding transcriptional ArsR family regulator